MRCSGCDKITANGTGPLVKLQPLTAISPSSNGRERMDVNGIGALVQLQLVMAISLSSNGREKMDAHAHHCRHFLYLCRGAAGIHIINANATEFFHVPTNLKIQICSELENFSDNSPDSVQYMKYSRLTKNLCYQYYTSNLISFTFLHAA